MFASVQTKMIFALKDTNNSFSVHMGVWVSYKDVLEKSVKMTPLQHKYRLRKSRPVQMKCEVVF